jgi:DNA-binding response OmpR family regulator
MAQRPFATRPKHRHKMERGMRVLIADGDEVVLDLAQRYLSDRGHKVNVATNGLETVASLRLDLPDVVVLDQGLRWGCSDGVRAIMQQVSRWSGIPLILTWSGMPDDSDSVAGPPVVARLQKPYRLKDLLDHLQACSLNGAPSPLSVVLYGGRP